MSETLRTLNPMQRFMAAGLAAGAILLPAGCSVGDDTPEARPTATYDLPETETPTPTPEATTPGTVPTPEAGTPDVLDFEKNFIVRNETCEQDPRDKVFNDFATELNTFIGAEANNFLGTFFWDTKKPTYPGFTNERLVSASFSTFGTSKTKNIILEYRKPENTRTNNAVLGYSVTYNSKDEPKYGAKKGWYAVKSVHKNNEQVSEKTTRIDTAEEMEQALKPIADMRRRLEAEIPRAQRIRETKEWYASKDTKTNPLDSRPVTEFAPEEGACAAPAETTQPGLIV